MKPALLLPCLMLLSTALPAHAQGTRVSRCTDASGQTVFTDRACEAVGARARLPPPAPSGNTLDRDQLGARCPRRLSELVRALRAAAGGGDVNRLSSLYLWGAVSDTGAQRVLGQLESIARRPLVDIVPVYPAPATAAYAPAQPPAASAAAPMPPTSLPARPIGLRLEQTLPGSATRSATVLGLRRQYGCFWISL